MSEIWVVEYEQDVDVWVRYRDLTNRYRFFETKTECLDYIDGAFLIYEEPLPPIRAAKYTRVVPQE